MGSQVYFNYFKERFIHFSGTVDKFHKQCLLDPTNSFCKSQPLFLYNIIRYVLYIIRYMEKSASYIYYGADSTLLCQSSILVLPFNLL